MGPLQDSKKMQEKEIARSRIPRLVLRPYLPKQKVSPSSESPFSEEDSKDFKLTSSRSARTISSNSFCSDDTGCPSSQSVSPVKTPSDAGMSPMGFCTGSEDDYSHKRVSTGTYTDGSIQPTRYKKEPKSGLMKTVHLSWNLPNKNVHSYIVGPQSFKMRGSEADFSSSSSTGSISAPEVHMSTASGGKKNSFSRNRVSHGRGHNSSSGKPAQSPPATREKDLFAVLCRNQRTMKYTSCGDNHGIKPPSPEQYLTPLQQKEVSIRHLKAKLKESQNLLQEREAEIEDLKSQLARMREDWIEEECHRVEAQLALKEARKEIKQLKQFIETMKNSLAEKDKGIQKYFIDINIQNKKLETLLRTMELAQDEEFRDEPCLDYFCNSPGASLTESAIYDKMSEGLLMEDQATEEMADCDLLLNDDLANRDDLYDEVLMETRSDLGSLANLNSTKLQSTACFDKEIEKIHSKWAQGSQRMEQAIQTDVVPYSLDLEKFIFKMYKAHNDQPINTSSSIMCGLHAKCSGSTNLIDLTPDDPNVAILLSPDSLGKDTLSVSNRAMKELDFGGPLPELPSRDMQHMCIAKRHWSDHFLTDLFVVAVPIIPTVLWALSAQRGYPDPVYNIGTMMRGCCLMALHTLRKTSYSPYI
ncbi:syntabulin isoform X7 [Aquarana catesbeiana]|uniref:syntabulin isoform X7 n=1 Tax=Aquarana catesbeiana TaxID=8400 RepID=UPI003CCA53EE